MKEEFKHQAPPQETKELPAEITYFSSWQNLEGKDGGINGRKFTVVFSRDVTLEEAEKLINDYRKAVHGDLLDELNPSPHQYTCITRHRKEGNVLIISSMIKKD